MEHMKELRKSRGLTQKSVADFLGVDRTTYVKYENGQSEPAFDTLQRLADFFHVSVGYLMGAEESCEIVCPPGDNWIPVLGEVRAGRPIDAIEQILDFEQLTPEMAKNGKHVGLRVVGDSMEPKFSEGDVVIVHLQPDIESGEIGIVIVDGDTATIKRVIKQGDGLMLVASNPAYPPRFFSNEEITTLPVCIFGKVVELRAKF